MLGGELSDGDEDGEESSSPLTMMSSQFNSALDEFREQWQQELKPMNESNEKNSLSIAEETSETDESIAKSLFVQGVELEKRGKVYDALKFYRKAIQIVPDIEFKWYESTKALQTSSTTVNNNLEKNSEKEELNDLEDLSEVNLYFRFQNDLAKCDYTIQSATADVGVISTSTHISQLPTEIILYILRWVVSSHLDIRSLEQCAAVCKGFYLCSRDDEIWRLVCSKIWGSNTGLLSNTIYGSWRDMFIERDRILFNGCYISKTTYLRYGENSFQDQFYRPVQLIEYYRYFRFLPDGNVIMWTTAEEPAQAVTKLKHITQLRSEILRGHYRLHGEVVTIMLKRNQKHAPLSKRKTDFENVGSYTYYIELKIVNNPKRRFVQLQWNNYSIIQIKNKHEIISDFELTPSKYPPMWFSRVKSYHSEAELPL